MASYENNDLDLLEVDLEVFEIDGALLRELLEEEGGKDDKDECVVESLVEEGNKVNPNMMDMEQELQQQQQQSGLGPYECHSINNDLEWMKMMDMMEPTANNPLSDMMIMNWFSDDEIDGMVDFGYVNAECYYSQMCDGLVSNEESYACLWENYDI